MSSDSFKRRQFLKLSAGSGVVMLAATVSSAASADERESDAFESPGAPSREKQAFLLKQQAANQHLTETRGLPGQKTNGDEARYRSERYYASFTKTLPSNPFGEADPAAFRKLLQALKQGRSQDFSAIPLAPNAARTLANPQGAFKFEVSGLDGHATRINPSWRFRSAELAGEVGEVYWQALTRDVPFIDYDIDGMVAHAVDDLNGFF